VRFRVVIGEQVYAIEVPEAMLRESAEFHAKLDHDMDRGWQMSREFVAQPDRLQRCQIVADKLLTSITQGNQATAMLMAAYIALRMPGAVGVDIDPDAVTAARANARRNGVAGEFFEGRAPLTFTADVVIANIPEPQP